MFMILPTLFVFALIGRVTTAADSANGIHRNILAVEALADVPGYRLSAVTVQLKPGVSVPKHRHDGLVFVYVLKGTVRSRLNNEKTVDYQTGDSWVERPGTVHSTTKNPSDKETALFLAVFVATENAKLTSFEKAVQWAKRIVCINC